MDAAPTSSHRPEGEFPSYWLDLQRILLLLAKALRFGLFPLGGYMPWVRRASLGVRLREFLEDLGLTFLKLGQFLALRFDLLPAEVCQELNQLFENVKPMSPEQAACIVQSELGAPVCELFRSFDSEPLAAASVAQVHVASLPDGSRVAVKVQRSGLRRIFEADIRNLRRLTSLIDALGLFGKLSATGMLNEFAQWTLRELDFTVEGRTADHLRAASQPDVIIPQIYWHLTTERVLTMEFVEGISVSDVAKLLESGGEELLQEQLQGFNLRRSLKVLAESCLSQLFVGGFFHGDPHPGNILFRADNRVVLLDFGIFGSLSDYEKQVLAGQIENLAIGNIEASFAYYAKQVIPTESSDFDSFRTEAVEVLQRWYKVSVDPTSSPEEKHLAKYTGEMIEVSRRNHLRYGFNYLLFWRALNNLNASLWLIAPNFDLMAELRTFFRRIRPGLIARLTGLVENTERRMDLFALAGSVPSAKQQTIQQLKTGQLVVHDRISDIGVTAKRRTLQTGRVVASLTFLNIFVLTRNSNWWPAAVLLGICLAIAAWFASRRSA